MGLPSNTQRVLLLSLLILLLTSGILLLLTGSSIFLAIFRWQLVLSPTSGSFPMWQTLPEPLLASMYLFKVLNADGIKAGQKPVLEEAGPYVFSEQHEKTGLQWSDNGTVTYRQVRTWHFLPHLSNGTLEDQITILNPVAASIGAMIQQQVPHWLWPGLNVLISKEELFVTRPVRELVFDGYNDVVLDEMDNITRMMPFLKKFIPPGITDKFAFFYQRNGSDVTDGVWNMHTGAGDLTKMGEVARWNYSPRGLFPGQCGEVRGSAGEFYPPGLGRDSIHLFSNDLGRSLELQFAREMEVKGILSHEYVMTESTFANGTENPENACYEPAGEVLRSGLYNTSLVRFGAPIFISQPHFLQADPWYSSLVSGLQPSRDLHGSSFRVEPRSGVPTDVVARFQLNVLLAPVSGITFLEDVPTAFFPVMWFENRAGVPDDLVFKMKLLSSVPDILSAMGWGEIGVFCSLIIILGMVSLTRKKEEDRSPILNRSLEERDEEVFLEKEEE